MGESEAPNDTFEFGSLQLLLELSAEQNIARLEGLDNLEYNALKFGTFLGLYEFLWWIEKSTDFQPLWMACIFWRCMAFFYYIFFENLFIDFHFNVTKYV